MKVPRGNEHEFAQSIGAQPEVEFAELDYFLVPDEFGPSDPGYVNQWHLPAISVPDAWDDSTGTGIIVAIVDSGFDGTKRRLMIMTI